MNDLLLVLTGILTTYVLNNKTLQEGFTSIVLKRMNKESFKVINLKDHTVFIHLRGYKNAVSLSVFNSETKSIFYQYFIKLLFTNIEIRLTSIINQHNKVDNIDTFILAQIDEMINELIAELENNIELPDSVRKYFNPWKNKLLASFRRSVEQVSFDDTSGSSYIQTYRVLDQVNCFINYLLSTGDVIFNQMNGAFDKLTPDQIIKNFK